MIISINQVYFAAKIILFYVLKKVFRVKNEKNDRKYNSINRKCVYLHHGFVLSKQKPFKNFIISIIVIKI